jgi:DNA polymerase III subunit delta'
MKGLDALVGQEAAVSTLRAAAARPVHAYLFVGPPGTGKLTAAMAFAAMLICPNGGAAANVHEAEVHEAAGAEAAEDEAAEDEAAGAEAAGDGAAGDNLTREKANGSQPNASQPNARQLNASEDNCETCRRVLEGVHPDVVIVEREGAALTIEQAREVTRVAARSSLEGGRSVVILPDLHLARETVPALLKTIEEPPGDTVFIGLAEFVPAELETIASRSARVDFRPLGDPEIAAVLQAEGVAPERAAALARLAGGRLDRARLLATDQEAEARRQSWEAVPARLDGTGATVSLLAEELVELLKRSAGPLSARQQAEATELAERYARDSASLPGRAGQGMARASGRELEERHRREQRRQRTDELRTGLAALAGAYRDRAVAGTLAPARAAEAVALVDALSADLAYNPGELLALQALLLRLDRLASS